MTSATDRMTGWPWNAFVGQKIIFINDKSLGLKCPWEVFPVVGQGYTIRCFDPDKAGRIFFRLVEIVNPEASYADGYGELAFGARNFRPLQTRDTSAEVEKLKRLTRGVRMPDEVRA